MNELKPCPFCGGEAEFKTELVGPGFFESTSKAYIYVRCKECHAETKAYKESPYYSALEKAIEAWDRRTANDSRESGTA